MNLDKLQEFVNKHQIGETTEDQSMEALRELFANIDSIKTTSGRNLAIIADVLIMSGEMLAERAFGRS